MPTLRAKVVVRFASACLLAAPISSSAQTIFDVYPLLPPQCRAVERLADRSWLTRQPVIFGRSVEVAAGAIVTRGTVLGGIDIGAVLDRECWGGEILPPVRF
ncbi:MAG: hypothetical protein JO288_20240 [Hyphomicrobiales bacterium]|nr:hypothetical protein [Hyphomicrobiales bacterium]